MKEALDPIIISLSGFLSLQDHIQTAIRSEELEPESVFARFAGTGQALSPHWFKTKQLEAHEAFWCFNNGIQSGFLNGELAWFQTGVYNKEAALLSVPLLVQAAVTATEQLGTCSFHSVRVQVPGSSHAVDEETVQQLTDQFSALGDINASKKVEARLFTSTRIERWSSAAASWFSDKYLEPILMLEACETRDRVKLDDRWCVRESKGTCCALFTVSEFSPAVAAVLVVLMVEAGRAAGINKSVVVEVSCV
ncbi:hypothetical protein [Micrococcoides hystricis]|uniref:Uncharacterized protein n=1 Tax=Micrococcoides hystricis TaxID=1572761 RepID=A0ABV6P7T7_9MICC